MNDELFGNEKLLNSDDREEILIDILRVSLKKAVDDYNNLNNEYEDLKIKYERKCALDYFNSHQEKLRYVVEKLDESINLPPETT
ncbi:hypothetical protein [Xenorhabdus hominickii]|nr:hypothetical protein [Xenorhabdus hominickii]